MTVYSQIVNLHRTFRNHPLWAKSIHKPWFRFLLFQLLVRLSPKEAIIRPWISPLKLKVSANSGITGHLYCGLLEFPEMMFLLHFIRPDDVFIDIGANAGVYSLLASGLLHAHSIAFEPVPATFAKLKQHVKLNGLDPLIECINLGVGDQQGIVRFSNNDNDCMNRVAYAGEDGGAFIEVPIVTLDQALSVSPSLMKLDIEGYELFALKGASRLLQNNSLNALIVETNCSALNYGVNDSQLEELLAQHGFYPYTYNPFTRKLLPSTLVNDGNTIFVKNDCAVQQRVQAAEAQCIYGTLL
jgi:FkbM family methyltransferase